MAEPIFTKSSTYKLNQRKPLVNAPSRHDFTSEPNSPPGGFNSVRHMLRFASGTRPYARAILAPRKFSWESDET
jgi:hypothetical protein